MNILTKIILSIVVFAIGTIVFGVLTDMVGKGQYISVGVMLLILFSIWNRPTVTVTNRQKSWVEFRKKDMVEGELRASNRKIEAVENVHEPDSTVEVTANKEELSERQLDTFYEKALVEYEEGETIKSFHSRSIVFADGDKSKERSEYIKLRVENLKKEKIERTINRENRVNEKNLSDANEKKKIIEQKNIEEINKKLERGEVSVNGMKYSSINEAKCEFNNLIKMKASIREKTFDLNSLNIECIEKNLSHDEVVNSYQSKIDKINIEIQNLKNAFSPIEF